MPTNSETERPYAVRLDGVLIETYTTEADAVAEARLLKRDLPENLIVVWNLRDQTSQIVTA
jgi:hypothetical protein